MTDPVVRQIVIAHDSTWKRIRQLLLREGLDVSRMPQLGDPVGIENYCLTPLGGF